MPVLAHLDIYHSRKIAPTRRVSLGDSELSVDPPPGFGGLLLAGVVATFTGEIDPDLHPDLTRLTHELEDGRRIPQPRLRYRFQRDRIGLIRSRHELVGDGEQLSFDFDDRGTPAQQVLGAVYAAGQVDPAVRSTVMQVVRRVIGWSGPVRPDLIASFSGLAPSRIPISAYQDPRVWALMLLGFEPVEGATDDPERTHIGHPSSIDLDDEHRVEVLRRFRARLREAHPDHGADSDGAAERIAQLTEARRILLER